MHAPVIHRNNAFTTALHLDACAMHRAGFFESMLYNGREVRLLADHVARLRTALAEWGATYPLVDHTALFHQLLERNHLTGRPARLNIWAEAGLPDTGLAATLTHTVAPYTPDHTPLALGISSVTHASSLGMHKSMNYAAYLLIRREATTQGYDDAILLEPDATHVQETTIGTLLLVRGEELITPKSAYALPSTAVAAVARAMAVTVRPVRADELTKGPLLVCNALAGARVVCAVDASPLPVNEQVEALAHRIRRVVCG